MDHVAILKKYLQNRENNDVVCVSYPFVTISRQAGAGGHTLARDIVRMVEKKLPDDMGAGWEVFDHKLCLLLAQDPELRVSFESLLAEEYRSEISQVIADLLSGQTHQYTMFKRIFEMVRALAVIGKVVIVGRAGSCLSADLPLGVRIRLVAGEETRIANMRQLLDTSRDDALKAIRKQDAERAHLLRDFFSRDIADPLGYDAVLNADSMTMTEMASLVADMIQHKIERYHLDQK